MGYLQASFSWFWRKKIQRRSAGGYFSSMQSFHLDQRRLFPAPLPAWGIRQSWTTQSLNFTVKWQCWLDHWNGHRLHEISWSVDVVLVGMDSEELQPEDLHRSDQIKKSICTRLLFVFWVSVKTPKRNKWLVSVVLDVIHTYVSKWNKIEKLWSEYNTFFLTQKKF